MEAAGLVPSINPSLLSSGEESASIGPPDSQAAVFEKDEAQLQSLVASRRKPRTYPVPPFLDGLINSNPQPDQERRPIGDITPINVDRVLEYAQHHKNFRLHDFEEVTDLPKYDDSTLYKIPEREETRLWRLELERLVKAATSNEHVLFNSNGLLGATGPEGFKAIEAIADQVTCNLDIILHDNAILDGKDSTSRSEKRNFDNCHYSLKTRLSEDTGDYNESTVRRQRPRILEANNKLLYYEFVNFVTAIVARYLYRCASSTTWNDICFAILAKWATKLKILEKDPIGFASMSLEAVDDLDDENDQIGFAEYLETRKLPGEKKYDRYSAKELYHDMETYFREVPYCLMRSIMKAPWVSNPYSRRTEQFETTTRVFRNGYESSHTAISSDRDAEFTAANDSRQLRYLRAALDILISNARQVKIRQSGPQQYPDAIDPVTMEWEWSCADVALRPERLRHPAQGRVTMTSMDDVVSLMTAHSLCSPDANMHTRSMIFLVRHCLLIQEDSNVLHEFVDEDFVTHVNIYNKAFEDSKSQRQTGENFRSLNDATMFTTRITPGGPLVATDDTSSSKSNLWSKFRDRSPPKDHLEVTRAKLEKTQNWRFDERTVIVPCKAYVRSCLTISAIVVIGGLAVPFSTRVRLPNVDPFNIASFTWIAVIFLLFLAQSRYVPTWAWHDFLHSRIVCRTVSELAAVSGLDPQLVLHKLLITEKSSNLHTRGPYNSMFTRTAPDGFSINIPCSTSTLYASGFVLFLGIGKTDRYVQVQDTRPVPQFFSASHHAWKEVKGVALPPESSSSKAKDMLNSKGQPSHEDVLRLRNDDFEGERLLGLFVGNRYFG